MTDGGWQMADVILLLQSAIFPPAFRYYRTAPPITVNTISSIGNLINNRIIRSSEIHDEAEETDEKPLGGCKNQISPQCQADSDGEGIGYEPKKVRKTRPFKITALEDTIRPIHRGLLLQEIWET